MKRSLLAFSAIALSLSTARAGYAAPTAQSMVAAWAGPWNCVSGKDHFTTVFTPVLGGTAMQIASNGANPNVGIATFDAKRKAWFYSGITAGGIYFSMLGTATRKQALSFREVAGNNAMSLDVRSISARRFINTFIFTIGGKKTDFTKTCSK